MLTFKRFLSEIKMSRISRALDKGDPIGTVSPERGGMSGKQKKAAHTAMKKDLSRESKKGMISFSGPHKGRYKYDGDAEPSKEGSYVLKPGNAPKAKSNFHRILKSIGRKYGQESVMKATKRGGAFHYTDGSKKVDSLGKVHYNVPLEKGSGDTQLKGQSSSFTVKEGKDK